MFEYAISQNQKQRPTRRILISWIVSCSTHILLLLLLIEYPHLLYGALHPRSRSVTEMRGGKAGDDNRNWRTVAVLRNPAPLTMPNAATLKKYIYDWRKKLQESPPIQVRWGDIKVEMADLPPVPRTREETKEQKPSIADTLPPVASSGTAGDAAGGAAVSGAGNYDSGAKNQAAIPLPPPEPEPAREESLNIAPQKAPESIEPAPDTKPAAKNPVKVFENEQKAIRSQESGFFDTKGFPLGEYASVIVERVKGNWFIPSSLKNSKGRTTVVFYIEKTGHYINARIVASSGNNTFDNAALMAIIDSDPFPPLPKGFPGEQVGAKFVFSYNEPY